ncbi:hypothetical protein BV210_06220 [Halorientalis sp. IM1011]|uniref:PGF-CTERM sorting domain-containing protein n=1 Tax=Halorientalis sp. IM1011 TaxID=1932360 RepID=UPI00097CCD23|nr:PGF-CTERM sorting domain-containing protein [Halorientalis sp. IM1011]AQL42331.1 hypothetical protein BV210_06220 [Halorientalis sp. IM1011]
MSLERTTHLFVGVLLALTLFSASAVTAAGAPTQPAGQTTNVTAANGTTTDSTMNETVGNLTVWTAPGDDFGNLTSPAAVEMAKREDWLVRTRTVAEGDTLPSAPGDAVVFGLPAPGLVEAVGAMNESESDAAAFVEVLTRSDTYDFRMEQTPDSTTPEMAPKELNLSATLAADGLRVVPDQQNGTLSVVFRTDRTVVDYGGDRDFSPSDGEDYRVNLTVTDGNVTTSSSVEWELVERSIDFDDHGSEGPVPVRLGQRCTVVSGETAVAPGTEIQLRLRSNETGPVRATAWTTVDTARQFATCVDTTGFDRNATLFLGAAEFDPDYDHPVVDRQFQPAALSADIRGVWTAPTERFGDLTSPAAVQTGRRDGWLTRNRSVAVNDTVMVAINAPDLATRIELTRGNDSATETFVRLVNRSSAYHFGMEQTEDTTLTEYDEKELNLSETFAKGAIRVLPDQRNGTLYVALRTDTVAIRYGSRTDQPTAGGEDYHVNYTVGTGSNANTSTVRWSAVERRVTFDDEQSHGIVVDDLGQECTRLSGTTTAAPTTTLRVTLRSQDGVVQRTNRTAVDQSRRFAVCADTTDIPADAVLSLSVDSVPDFRGVLVENRTGPLLVSVEKVTDDRVGITSASRNTSGFVVLYAAPEDAWALTDPSRPPDCTPTEIDRTVANWTRLAESYDLSPGYYTEYFDRPTIEDDQVLIAVVHPNEDGEFDLDFPPNDRPVCHDGALVGTAVNHSTPPFANDSKGPTRTTLGSTTGSTDTTETGQSTATAPTTSQVDGPGFGALGTVLAVFTVVLIARRRN